MRCAHSGWFSAGGRTTQIHKSRRVSLGNRCMHRRYFRSRVGVHECGGLRAVRRRLYSRRSTAYGNFFARCGEVLVVRTKRILKNHRVLRAVSPNPGKMPSGTGVLWGESLWSTTSKSIQHRPCRTGQLIRNTHAEVAEAGLFWLTQNPVTLIWPGSFEMALRHRWVRSDTSVGSGQRLVPVALDADRGTV